MPREGIGGHWSNGLSVHMDSQEFQRHYRLGTQVTTGEVVSHLATDPVGHEIMVHRLVHHLHDRHRARLAQLSAIDPQTQPLLGTHRVGDDLVVVTERIQPFTSLDDWLRKAQPGIDAGRTMPGGDAPGDITALFMTSDEDTDPQPGQDLKVAPPPPAGADRPRDVPGSTPPPVADRATTPKPPGEFTSIFGPRDLDGSPPDDREPVPPDSDAQGEPDPAPDPRTAPAPGEFTQLFGRLEEKAHQPPATPPSGDPSRFAGDTTEVVPPTSDPRSSRPEAETPPRRRPRVRWRGSKDNEVPRETDGQTPSAPTPETPNDPPPPSSDFTAIFGSADDSSPPLEPTDPGPPEENDPIQPLGPIDADRRPDPASLTFLDRLSPDRVPDSGRGDDVGAPVGPHEAQPVAPPSAIPPSTPASPVAGPSDFTRVVENPGLADLSPDRAPAAHEPEPATSAKGPSLVGFWVAIAALVVAAIVLIIVMV